MELFKSTATGEDVDGGVECHRDQDCQSRIPVCGPNNEEKDENSEGNKTEPLQDGVGQCGSKHTSVQNKEKTEEPGDHGLLEWAQHAVEISVVSSEIIHLTLAK